MEHMRKPQIEEEWFSDQVSDSLEKVEKLAKEIRLTFKLLGEEIGQYGLEKVKKRDEREDIQYPEEERKFKFEEVELAEGESWIPKLFAIYYESKNWREYTGTPSLHVSFSLEKEDIEEGNVITVSLSWKDKATEEELVKEVRKKLKTKKYDGLSLYLDDDGYLYVTQKVALHGLVHRDIVDELVKKLVKMREFAESLEILRKVLGLDKISRRTKRAK